MSKQYTSAQVAEMLGYSRSMVLLVCQKKSLPRVGNQYVLGEEDIATIKDALGHKPTGRPKKIQERRKTAIEEAQLSQTHDCDSKTIQDKEQ